jgi:hypothetical protein
MSVSPETHDADNLKSDAVATKENQTSSFAVPGLDVQAPVGVTPELVVPVVVWFKRLAHEPSDGIAGNAFAVIQLSFAGVVCKQIS